ncbi:hypothetical protein V8B97DRAFT_2022218 [Scleroderma yunnanense]
MILVSSGIDLIRLCKSLAPLESGAELDQEGCLLDRHPPAITGIGGIPAIISESAIILGEGDTIALWYLPGALARPMPSHIMAGLGPLHDPFQRSITNKGWRISSNYFRNGGISSGCLEFSPARHLWGHETWKHQPMVENICLPSALLSGALSTMHPSLYQAGLQAMEGLNAWSAEQDGIMVEALAHWSTVYTNFSVIANQCTPLHHDPHSQPDWYDLLATVGEYDNCFLDIPTLGTQLRDSVTQDVGDRCCLAYYMQDNVHNWLCISRPDWMIVDNVWHALLMEEL